MCSFKTKKSKFKGGFTLLELMLVVIIIGLLAVVAIPVYRNVITKTRASKAQHAISLIAHAQQIYHDEEGEYLDNLAELQTETGINLGSVENDPEWGYTMEVTGTYPDDNLVVTAAYEASGHPCDTKTITYDLDTGLFDVDACFR
jgi:prepilin-type N-terminal cleavage/methylation domain-containing protein